MTLYRWDVYLFKSKQKLCINFHTFAVQYDGMDCGFLFLFLNNFVRDRGYPNYIGVSAEAQNS